MHKHLHKPKQSRNISGVQQGLPCREKRYHRIFPVVILVLLCPTLLSAFAAALTAARILDLPGLGSQDIPTAP